MLLRLDPPIPLQTPFGEAVAHIYSDGGLESECFWVCFCSNGAVMEFANSEVRACRNFTIGRNNPIRPARHPLSLQKKPPRKRKRPAAPRAEIRTNGAAVHNGQRHHNGLRHG